MITVMKVCRLRHSLPQKRYFFDYLYGIFNSVDNDRIKQVGPDRACAEWLIKNGAGVRWCGTTQIFKDYNSLEGIGGYCIEEIDASNSSITHHGFPYLKGCTHIQSIILHKCTSLEDRALPFLKLVNPSLRSLQLSGCWNISEKGLDALTTLTNLKKLQLFDLPGVNQPSAADAKLRSALKGCTIEYKY